MPLHGRLLAQGRCTSIDDAWHELLNAVLLLALRDGVVDEKPARCSEQQWQVARLITAAYCAERGIDASRLRQALGRKNAERRVEEPLAPAAEGC
jgi:hypothetical protein